MEKPVTLDAPLTSQPGIGPQRAALFARLNVRTVGELLRLYPRTYEDRTRLVSIASLEAGTPACFEAAVVTTPRTNRIPKPGSRMLEVTKFTVADDTGRLNLTFFNAAHSAGALRVGERYCFYGVLTGDFAAYGMTNPLFEPCDGPAHVTRRILPVYPLTAGLTNSMVLRAQAQAVSRCAGLLPETLPPELLRRYGLCGAAEACREIHCPTSAAALGQAQRRLVFEEFFLFSAALAIVRSRRTAHSCPAWQTELTPFFAALPFRLTGAQQRAVDDICADVRTGRPMSRLVQGDVGSGKTMVAAAAACLAAKNGVQTALLAPTEILARQHFDRLAPLFESLGIRTVLLTGQMGAAQKRSAREAAELGLADVVIGTHALLTEQTRFARLGMVIADEQHRFGVAQRAALCAKGTQPHLLLLSATPIPRTLALIVYGDLDVSVVDELPPGREPVETFLVDERYRARLNAFVRKQAAEGHQSFIVCPAVEDDGGDGGETLKAAEQWAQTLQDYVFPNLRVALLHGKMKGAEKEAVMASFAAGEADILVATTVIEVGVDVPNATLMVIENADRFGLSQLHQLRGRVGRGSAKAWCVLVSDNKNPETRQRLRTLCGTNDGFRIAEADLQQRGPGDFFGSRQHGLPVFRVGDLATDLAVLRQAQEAAAQLVSQDRPLPSPLAQAIESLLAGSADTLN